jgi:hypothetical protein
MEYSQISPVRTPFANPGKGGSGGSGKVSTSRKNIDIKVYFFKMPVLNKNRPV